MTDDASDVLLTDYGGFNPRFIGLNFLFDSPGDYNFVFSYLTDTPVPPESPMSSSMSDLHRIALLSVSDHEHRHYIDFLLSSYSMSLFRMRMQAVINGLQAINGMRTMAGDVVPVPLSRWAILDGPGRAERQVEWSQLLHRQVVPIDLPIWTSDELSSNLPPTIEPIHGQGEVDTIRTAEAAIRSYLRIEQLTRGFEASISEPYVRSPNVHEASALTVQIAAIWVGQGEIECRQFIGFLLDNQTPQAQMWQKCFQLAALIERSGPSKNWTDEDLFLAIRRILTITTWSLLGNYQLDGADASAARRLFKLLAYAVSDPSNTRLSCDIDDADSIRQMWSYWDDITGAPTTWIESLTENVLMTRRGVEMYEEVRRGWRGSVQLIESVIAVAEQVSTDQKKVVDVLADDPTTLVDPFKYVRTEQGVLPSPDVRLAFQGFGVDPAEATAGRPILRQKASGEEYVSGVAFSPGRAGDHDILEKKLALEGLIEWCDVLFSDLSVPDHSAISARIGLAELTGKRLLQLL